MSAQAERLGPIAWMARNPIAANLLMLLLLGGGIWTTTFIQKEVFPEFQLDIVETSVSYPGAAPEEVENAIILPIEEAVRGIQGIQEIRSRAREGSGSVSMELVAGTNRMRAYQDIDQAVGRIRTFPDEVQRPEVRLQARQRQVMVVGLYGHVDPWELRELAQRLHDRLLSDPAISQVEIRRVPSFVTHVEIPHARLLEHDLTLGEVGRIVSTSSRDVPAGDIQTHTGEVLLRLKDRKQWAEDFASIPIATSTAGSAVLLGDIATVTDGFEERTFHGQFNQQPTVDLSIYRVGKQSPLDISTAVRAVLADFETTLPEGVSVRVDSSSADDYDDRLSLLLGNGAMAVLIVLGILAVFLELRVAFWVMMGMTISFVGAILFLPLAGVSINMISMFGFLVALGIVVDDAIVVGENVHEHRERGASRLEAAILGTREVARPVTLAVLTSLVAFVPLLFIPGTTGRYWWPLPVVVLIVLSVSLVEALFILPAHLSHAGGRTRLERALDKRQAVLAGAIRRAIHAWFEPLLRLSLRYRYVTLAAAVGVLLVVGSYGWSGHMGMVMMPEVSADEIECGVRLPVGTTPDQAARVAEEITRSTQRMFDEHDLDQVAEGIKTNVRGESFIDVEIVLKPPDERDMTAGEVIALWREEIGDIDGVHQLTFEAERGPGGWRPDIAIDLGHSDIQVLEEATEALVARLEAYEAVQDVGDNYDRGKEQLDLTLLPEGRALGLTSAMVGQQVRDAFYGALALRQLRGVHEVEVRVKLPEHEREDLDSVLGFMIRTPDGIEVPLLDVVDVHRDASFNSISRRNGRRAVTVRATVEPKSALNRVMDSVREVDLPAVRADLPGLTWTFMGSEAEMRESTRTLWGSFTLALAVIYSILAVAFRSYVQPLIVLVAVPFGIIGAVMGHILLGYDLSLVSLMGIIALSGVVVNDSLIMVDLANRLRAETTALEAIRQAGVRRFRPILLTTLTTFGGLFPIIMETSNQAHHLIPMAISLGCGIVVSTAIILLLVPSLYMILEDVRGRDRA